MHYRSVHRLWGKVYDICSRNRSHHFVVTTYWGWVFGAFSAGTVAALRMAEPYVDDLLQSIRAHGYLK